MSDIDVNKIQQNVKELQNQNFIDFQQWKKLGKDIEKLSEKIKLSDTNLIMLMKKIKNDYENLKKIIVDENVQVQLNNKIEKNKNEIITTNVKIVENKNEINKKVNVVTFQNTIDEINSHMDTKATKDELDVTNGRIDNIVAIKDSTDNLETADIRVGADGVTYDSAGTSVRTQIKDVYNNIGNGVSKGYKTNYSNPSIFEIGGINASGGHYSNETCIRTKSYINTNIKKINVLDENYIFMIVKYSSDGTFTDRLTSLTTFDNFDYSNYKYRVVLQHVDNTTKIDTSYYYKIAFLGEKLEFLDTIDKFIKPNVITQAQTTFLKPSKNLLIGELIENYYVSWRDGKLLEGSKYNVLTNILVEGGSILSLNRHNALTFHDEQGNYVGGINGSGTDSKNYTINEGDIEGQNMHGKYTVPSNAVYMTVTLDKTFSNQQLEVGETSTNYEEPCLQIKNLYYPKSKIHKNTFVKKGNECTINLEKSCYIFKKVTDSSINVNTWRLYEGNLIDKNKTKYLMWNNSDAEGAIRIKGEDDFVCGYHGDEQLTTINIIIDGTPIDISSDYNVEFTNLTIVVTSDVYHCNTSINAKNKAFERVKMLNFKGNTVSIANRFKCLEDLLIIRGALMLFQCYKSQDGTTIINKFSNNNDLIIYDVPNESSEIMPSNSKNMTQAKFYTNCGVIDFKAIKGHENQYYDGYINNFNEQNRLKIYFDYIKSSTNGTQVNIGDILQTEFQFTIE